MVAVCGYRCRSGYVWTARVRTVKMPSPLRIALRAKRRPNASWQ